MDEMRTEPGHKKHKILRSFCFLCAFLWLLFFFTGAQSSRQVEWLYYGGDQAGTKYSPLADINANNVERLEIAWQWKHWETPLSEYDTTPGFFEATPLMIDGVLYVTTPYNSIATLDADTGKELWRFDGEAYKLGQVLSASGWKLRGTGFWRDNGRLRIFLNSRHRLFSLDAYTGEPVHTFGNNGEVSLTDLPRISDIKHSTQSSPPVIYKDLVIVGSQVPDRVQVSDPVGYVQAINTPAGARVDRLNVSDRIRDLNAIGYLAADNHKVFVNDRRRALRVVLDIRNPREISEQNLSVIAKRMDRFARVCVQGKETMPAVEKNPQAAVIAPKCRAAEFPSAG